MLLPYTGLVVLEKTKNSLCKMTITEVEELLHPSVRHWMFMNRNQMAWQWWWRHIGSPRSRHSKRRSGQGKSVAMTSQALIAPTLTTAGRLGQASHTQGYVQAVTLEGRMIQQSQSPA
jgi:hypothetical protein